MYLLPNNHISGSRELASTTAKNMIKRPAPREKSYPPVSFTNTKFGRRYAKNPHFEEEAEIRRLLGLTGKDLKTRTKSRYGQPQRGSLAAAHTDYTKKELPALPLSDTRDRRADHLVKSGETTPPFRSIHNCSVADLEDWFRPLGNPSYLEDRPSQNELANVPRHASGKESGVPESSTSSAEYVPVNATLRSWEMIRKKEGRPTSWTDGNRFSWLSESDESVDFDEEMDELAGVLEDLLEY